MGFSEMIINNIITKHVIETQNESNFVHALIDKLNIQKKNKKSFIQN